MKNIVSVMLASAFAFILASALIGSTQACAATPQSVEMVAKSERQLALDSLWTAIVQTSVSRPVTDEDKAALVAKAKEAQTAINEKRYADADTALADLLDIAVKAFAPKTAV